MNGTHKEPCEALNPLNIEPLEPLNRLKGFKASMPNFTSDEARWAAVLTRNRSADGYFVYGVRSTGIYCRPICPSRRPLRELVAFFSSPVEAERSGYRACKRCRPQAGAAADPWIAKVRDACQQLAGADTRPSLAALAVRAGSSPFHFQRNFKRLVGLTPHQFADACRMRDVRRALRTDARVTDAVYDAGYGSNSRFYERAAPRLGMKPSTYKKGGAGMAIQYATVDSPLGRLLVAATPKGVCAVAMGTSDAALVRELAREYPAASLTPNPRSLRAATAAIVEHLNGRRPTVDLPLDVQATSFQWQVWTALAAIPYGETRTYAEVARSIGRPRAVRAVARACATNPAAVAIPCHRVVPARGDVGGYRWGVSRKEALLATEAAHCGSGSNHDE
jgi:AraC family transcriptional regulator of adaptative response/methylated-DNA-[protein]-cysteine methyltransferase